LGSSILRQSFDELHPDADLVAKKGRRVNTHPPTERAVT